MYRRRRYGARVGGLGGLFVGLIFGAVWLVQNVLGTQLPFGEAAQISLGPAKQGRFVYQALTPMSSSEEIARLWVSQGQVAEITYFATVEKGKLQVELVERRGLIQILQSDSKDWRKTVAVQRSERKTIQVQVPHDSHYAVVLDLWGFQGAVDVKWSVK